MYFYKLPADNPMSLHRIKAILFHDFFVMKHSFEVINDLILYPLWSIIVFGFMTLYIAGTTGQIVASQVLLGTILWQIVSITQYSIAVGCLWDVWARNLTNIFITPITTAEYLVTYALSGAIKAIFVIILASIMSYFVFKFNILTIGLLPLIVIVLNLVFFGFSFGILVLGLIFRFGTKIQAFAWGFITVFQPLMAVIYPVTVLPAPLRGLSLIFPPTHLFEASRKILNGSSDVRGYFLTALVLNVIFCAGAVLFFNTMFRQSKESGQFARLEG